MSLIEELARIEKDARGALLGAADEAALEDWRVAFLGRRRGRLTDALAALPTLDIAERRTVGAESNRIKNELEAALEQRRAEIRERTHKSGDQPIDVTLPGRPLPAGRLHPITQTLNEILEAFRQMGFQVAEGPEIEWDYYNFEMLRIPKYHPARDMWDTLWMDYERDGERPMLLRTHTSPNQIRIMEQTEPPIRVVVPGRCYRYEATDATHEWMMTQVEGLAVDEGISLAEFKGTLYEFARRLFGKDRKVRFRCDYFPFVEPGADVSVDCFLCDGKGCRVCGDGWIEIMGAGMVHREILENMGYDADRYTGFAFGMGVERVALNRHNVEDIRLFYQNDLRFLRQF
ncbi:MAG: phenylalanine--tRNA ligase subunit alpha [Dehalococcoidia bacterium]|nr:phenylalanine--tRNA ligase subunit alpha [Dehalococcoidia bacterium]